MSSVKLYTYAEAEVPGLVRTPKGPHMAAAYACGLPEVGAEVHTRAAIGHRVAKLVLDAHVSGQSRSSHPGVELVKGDRTDWHVNMTVDADSMEEAVVAALSIEYGHRYIDSLGQPKATQGVGALRAALAAMGAW